MTGERTLDLKKDVFDRIKKIEGQSRGVQRMLEEDRECDEIIIQLAAIKSALTNIAFTLILGKPDSCLSDQFKNRLSNTDEELLKEIKKMMAKFS